MARRIELLELVLRSRPTQPVICKARQSSVRLAHCQAKSCDHCEVRDSVEDHHALRHQVERSRRDVAPADSCSIDTPKHDQVTDASLVQNVADRWGVNLDWERWSLEGAIELVIVMASPKHAQGAERAPRTLPVRLHDVAAVIRCSGLDKSRKSC